MGALRLWPAIKALADQGAFEGGENLRLEELTAPVPDPGAIYGLSANFPAFVEERPAVPAIFMKSPTSVTGPFNDVMLPGPPNYDQVSPMVTWEAELGVVIGTRAHCVSASAALDIVAGFVVAQDLTERRIQFALGTKHPEFVAAKSYPGFCPIGPWLTSVDVVRDEAPLRIQCKRNGETVQDEAMTAALFSVPEALAYVSAITVLRPGDLMLMGTPPTINAPDNWALIEGDILETEITGLGLIRNRMIAGHDRPAHSED